MTKRNGIGEGTIYKRQDGRYEAAIYVTSTSGTRRRLRMYGRTRAEVRERLLHAQQRERQGVPTPDRAWTVSTYLDHWLANIVKTNKRPATYAQYAWIADRFLKPGLGAWELTRLQVATVQRYMNDLVEDGYSAHRARLVRMVLSAALHSAEREEVITRNVARLVVLPQYQATERKPWSADEARHFLKAARSSPSYAAFLLLVIYGLRRGEVLGLRWQDIDFNNAEISIRSQVQRVAGELQRGPVKTRAGQRDLPLVDIVRDALREQQMHQRSQRTTAELPILDSAQNGLCPVFGGVGGNPLDPDSFAHLFHRICTQHGIREIRLHDIRHTTATLLKGLGIPARDAQLILGHADIATTQQIYQHDDMSTRRLALSKVEKVFLRVADGVRSRQTSRQMRLSGIQNYITSIWCARQDLNLRPLVPELLSANLEDCLTSVRETANERTMLWLMGAVAVNVAVKNSSHPQEEAA